jgi:hypothetical protein
VWMISEHSPASGLGANGACLLSLSLIICAQCDFVCRLLLLYLLIDREGLSVIV